MRDFTSTSLTRCIPRCVNTPNDFVKFAGQRLSETNRIGSGTLR
jgi:hypothetical protein